MLQDQTERPSQLFGTTASFCDMDYGLPLLGQGAHFSDTVNNLVLFFWPGWVSSSDGQRLIEHPVSTRVGSAPIAVKVSVMEKVQIFWLHFLFPCLMTWITYSSLPLNWEVGGRPRARNPTWTDWERASTGKLELRFQTQNLLLYTSIHRNWY